MLFSCRIIIWYRANWMRYFSIWSQRPTTIPIGRTFSLSSYRRGCTSNHMLCSLKLFDCACSSRTWQTRSSPKYVISIVSLTVKTLLCLCNYLINKNSLALFSRRRINSAAFVPIWCSFYPNGWRLSRTISVMSGSCSMCVS